jgi:hypothetical protein
VELIQIARFAPMAGTPAEPLWIEGEASYVEAGRGLHARVTPPAPDLIGWVAMVGGAPAALQACRVTGGEAGGLLSWCRPAYRRQGLFRAIQAQVDADLLDMGCAAIRSWVVPGPDAAAMGAAIAARGGALVGQRTMRDGLVYDEWLRPLRRG